MDEWGNDMTMYKTLEFVQTEGVGSVRITFSPNPDRQDEIAVYAYATETGEIPMRGQSRFDLSSADDVANQLKSFGYVVIDDPHSHLYSGTLYARRGDR